MTITARKPSIVYVVRHADRVWDLRVGPYMSSTIGDVGLTQHGQDQARELAEFFHTLPRGEQPSVILSSLYHRAVETAEPVSKLLGVSVRLEPGLTCVRGRRARA